MGVAHRARWAHVDNRGDAPGIAVAAAMVAVLSGLSRLLPAGRWRELAGFVTNCLVLLRRLRADRRLPRRARLALGAAIAYLVSPVQLIPNFIPVIGQSDDLVVITSPCSTRAVGCPATRSGPLGLAMLITSTAYSAVVGRSRTSPSGRPGERSPFLRPFRDPSAATKIACGRTRTGSPWPSARLEEVLVMTVDATIPSRPRHRRSRRL